MQSISAPDDENQDELEKLSLDENKSEEQQPIDRLQQLAKKIKYYTRDLDYCAIRMKAIMEQEILPHLADKHGIRISWDDNWLYEKNIYWADKWQMILWSSRDSQAPPRFQPWYKYDEQAKDYKQCKTCRDLKNYYAEEGELDELDVRRAFNIDKKKETENNYILLLKSQEAEKEQLAKEALKKSTTAKLEKK